MSDADFRAQHEPCRGSHQGCKDVGAHLNEIDAYPIAASGFFAKACRLDLQTSAGPMQPEVTKDRQRQQNDRRNRQEAEVRS